MICMINEGVTRRLCGKERGSRIKTVLWPIQLLKYRTLLDLASNQPRDLQYDWLMLLSESVIWRLFDAAQRHPRRVLINPLRFHTLPSHLPPL